jgi:hypothetical protein
MEASDFPVVIVKWADAHASQGGWLTLDEYEDDGECIITTIGYLVPADQPGGKKDHVTVWQTITEGDAIHGFHIPVAMVRSTLVIPTEKPVDGLDTPSL